MGYSDGRMRMMLGVLFLVLDRMVTVILIWNRPWNCCLRQPLEY